MQKERQFRTAAADFITRDDKEPIIEGYFAVFDANYEIADGLSESIAQGAFTDTLAGDIRALVDHDTRLVLGRTTAHTLELSQDTHGLYGKIYINPDDTDAMNLYQRVKRGDVNQCSFGFHIEEETAETFADGRVHWTLQRVKLYEVSCCTFPAYKETAITARKQDIAEMHRKWCDAMRYKLKGENEKWF